ncbi:MAG: hypothetical protein Ct9H300mP4_11180 [Gammaproteobacteria bacterium]|nr:MAG: hypothetical protein Ct9H300mP4_11180 [Gammaproteobacteria bacterium]
MLVKISQGGAPRMEVRRSLVEVNPTQDPDYFKPLQGWATSTMKWLQLGGKIF